MASLEILDDLVKYLINLFFFTNLRVYVYVMFSKNLRVRGECFIWLCR